MQTEKISVFSVFPTEDGTDACGDLDAEQMSQTESLKIELAHLA